jgi:hypothetical protein
MSTTLTQPTNPSLTHPHQPTPLRRFLGVVIDPQSYRNIGYLLLGLLLGTVWFTVLISAVAIGISLLVVALLGIPILIGLWYATRVFANVERSTANVLLGQRLAHHPLATNHGGNLWIRLRSMTGDRDRWRELSFLLLRFPVGVATFTVATTALAMPAMVAYAPIAARSGDAEPFGDWALSSTMQDVASSPWAWILVPLGVLLLVGSFHLLNALAKASGRWAAAWLGAQ